MISHSFGLWWDDFRLLNVRLSFASWLVLWITCSALLVTKFQTQVYLFVYSLSRIWQAWCVHQHLLACLIVVIILMLLYWWKMLRIGCSRFFLNVWILNCSAPNNQHVILNLKTTLAFTIFILFRSVFWVSFDHLGSFSDGEHILVHFLVKIGDIFLACLLW